MIRKFLAGATVAGMSLFVSASAEAATFSTAMAPEKTANAALHEAGWRDGHYRRRRHVHREHCVHYRDHDHCHTDHITTRRRWHGDHYHVERSRRHGHDDHVHHH